MEYPAITSTGRSRTLELVTAALITALIAASAWITIPLGAIPLTLQVFFVVLAALLLKPRWAAASMAAYLALGAIGLPIFSGAKGGLGVLAGPTGGYLIGFVVGATVGALLRTALERRLGSLVADVIAAASVIVIVYAIGTVQLAVVLDLSAVKAIAAGVVPFVAIDAAKAVAAVAAAAAIRRARSF